MTKVQVFAQAMIGLLIALVLTSCATVDGSATSDPTLVQTEKGLIRGLDTGDGVYEFLGVRYAKAPVGDLRFRAPQPLDPWSGEMTATAYGEATVQMSAGAGAARYPPAVGAAMAEAFASPDNISAEGSEDSLFLNVYTPSTTDDAKRPVMVWFHGGGFSYGQAASKIYRGHNLAKKHDVVFVGVNHRLNMFGYMPVDTLGLEGFDGAANAGMLDLVASLQWVADNIDKFGGDPDNVTIFGQSGGGSKVTHLLAMPGARGLFHKAIVQSGAGLTSGTREEAVETAELYLKNLGVTREEAPEALRSLPVEKLLEAAWETGTRRFRPTIDGRYITRHPLTPDAPAQVADVPVMVGYTKDEMTLYNVGDEAWGTTTRAQLLAAAERVAPGQAQALIDAFASAYPDYSDTYLAMQVQGQVRHLQSATALAERKARQGAPVYSFIFAHDLPPQDFVLKSPHTAEIPYVMDNVEEAPLFAGTTAEDFRVADVMSSYWTNFARTGNPNGPGLPTWPQFTPDGRDTMILDATPEAVQRPFEAVYAIVGPVR